VFVIWEPMLITDWRRPGASQTAFPSDPRAVHYWDIDHRLSALYGGREHLDALASVEKVGFAMRRVIWDAALVYPPGVMWGARADLLVAPVVKYRDDLARTVRAAKTERF
jgi:hypothetical protein